MVDDDAYQAYRDDDHIPEINEPRIQEVRLNWNFSIYIDTCHSGSAIDATKEWVKRTSGKALQILS